MLRYIFTMNIVKTVILVGWKGVFVLVFAVCSCNLGAVELTVGSDQPYATISEAVAAASRGDSIHVFPGTYTEVVAIAKPGITLGWSTLAKHTVVGRFVVCDLD